MTPIPRQLRSQTRTPEDHPLGICISVRADGPRVLVLHLRPALFELANRHQRSFEQIERLKARDDDRRPVARSDGLIFAIAHHGAHVARSEERLHPVLRRLQNSGDRRRDQDVRHQHGEVRDTLGSRLPHRHRVGRRCGFEADREKTTFFFGFAARF